MEVLPERHHHSSPSSLLRETNSLVSLPQVCLRLREVTADPDHSSKEIANIIVHDPALTTRILRIANSVYYGLAQPISSIIHALNILGEKELNNLVIVTSLVKTMRSIKPPMDTNSHWRSSIFSAVMARNLAIHCGIEDELIEEYFIAGLLLDIGKLLLYFSEPDLLEVIESELRKGGSLDFEIEQRHLGFDHADVGAELARTWNFSEDLIGNIQEHHKSHSEQTSLGIAIAQLTGTVCDKFDFKNPRQIGLDKLNIEDLCLEKGLNLTTEQLCVTINNSYEDYLHAYEAFCGGPM